MKKRNYFLIGAAGLILASCANDDLKQPASGDISNISIALNTPQLQTRGYSDGKSANQLQYAVYEVSGNSYKKVSETETKDNFEISANINLQLSNGHEYAVIFWAGAKENSPYTVEFTEDGASMTVNYDENTKANDANLDAFYVCHNLGTINGDRQVNVGLTRPFAQINIGTNDYDKVTSENDVPTQSAIKIDNAPSKLDLITGEVSGENDVEFKSSAINRDTEAFPKKDGNYKYLAMAYILVGEKTNHEVTFSYETNAKVIERTVSSVPVERNHRTNIYGSILTSTQNLVVEVKPGFSDEEDILLTWDGETVTTPEINGDEVSLVQASDFAGIAKMVEEGENFEGITILVENDLDMGGHEFPMIGKSQRGNPSEVSGLTNTFKGTFDGQGHTIKNVVVRGSDNAKDAIGFISNLDGGELKNTIFESFSVDAPQNQSAGVVGIVTNGGSVSGVIVKSGNVKASQGAGGIVGRIIADGSVSNCENHAEIELSGYNGGGIVGAAYYTDKNASMTIENCKNYGKVSGTYGIGGVVGLSAANVTGCHNYGETVKGSGSSVGGVVGEQKASGSVTNCTNKADVSTGTASNIYGTGGIVGWVRYITSGETSSYPKLTSIVVSGNVNEGKHISGVSGVGGIVGMWYHDGECKENTSYAETITATGFAAGIVGASQWSELGSDLKKEGETTLILTVHDNTSYTERSNIKGGNTHDFIYINNPVRTQQQNNKNPGVVNATSTESLADALANAEEDALIRLGNGTYTLPNKMTRGVILEGNGDTNLDLTNSKQRSGYNDVTFKNMNVIFQKDDYNGIISSDNVIFENCVIEGQPFSYASNAKYLKCTFNQTSSGLYNIWAYTSTPVIFSDCEFYSAGKALLIYNEGGIEDQTVYINNCKFYASQPASGKAAIEIDSRFCNMKVYINNCSAEGFDLGSVSGNSLWNVKAEGKTANVFVNDEIVH